MSNTTSDYLRNVHTARTDWKVKVRIIREWRGSKGGEVFKGFNLLLLDAKNCRMQAYVPPSITERIGRTVKLGNLYVVKNFEVQKYTAKDKFRPVQIENKIIFTTSTKISDLDERDVFIPKNMFDLFQFSDLKKVAAQEIFLPDVIGIIPKKEKLNKFKNKHGVPQSNIKFKLFDGRTKINVTFWDSFAAEFVEALDKETADPIILIIASARVTTWQDQTDICNYSPTRFYINYDHHSVHQLRKEYNGNEFLKNNLCARRKSLKLVKVDEIKNLCQSFIEDEVVCKATIKCVQEVKSLKYFVCTSCYGVVELDKGYYNCKACNRELVEPNLKFNIPVIAYDETGQMEMMLQDRAIRTIVGDNSFLSAEDDGFGEIKKILTGKGYTIKVFITKANVEKKDNIYAATDLFEGFEYEEPNHVDEPKPQNSESFTAQPSTSSYHLDDISQLNYMAQ